VLNIPALELAETVVGCGNNSGRRTAKSKTLGLTHVAATCVKAPLIAECYVSLDCKVRDGKLVTKYNFFILEVVQAWIDPAPKHPRTIHHLKHAPTDWRANEQLCSRNQKPDATPRRVHGGGCGEAFGPCGRGLRLARFERRGQNPHDQDARHAISAHFGRSVRGRLFHRRSVRLSGVECGHHRMLRVERGVIVRTTDTQAEVGRCTDRKQSIRWAPRRAAVASSLIPARAVCRTQSDGGQCRGPGAVAAPLRLGVPTQLPLVFMLPLGLW